MIKPPKGFTHLQWAVEKLNQTYDVIGVCVDYMEPTKSRGTDYTSQFVLHDPSWTQDRGLKFRFFQNSIEKLPKIQGNGDVVILRNVTTRTYNNQLIGMTNSKTSWVVLLGSSILESTCLNGSDIVFVTSNRGYDATPAPTVEELKYAKEIVSMEDSSNYRPPPKSTALDIENIMKTAGGTPAARKDKWQLIKDLTPTTSYGGKVFADLFGEVRKSWYNNYGRVELSITDYTTNKLLYNFAEESQTQGEEDAGYLGTLYGRWPGPWGRMTLSVLLYDAHAAFAKSNVEPGDYILIKNCHVKLDPNGTKLEAVCRGDRDDMSKVNISIYNPRQIVEDERFKDMLKRRLEYEKSARTKGLRFDLEKHGQSTKKHNLETLEILQAVTTNKTELENDLKPKRKRKRGVKQASEAVKTSTAKTSDVPISTNQYVRCKQIDVPLKPINDILDPSILDRKTPTGIPYTLPFQNCSYKSKVRVVDYYPHDLVFFSVPHLVTEYDALSDIETGQQREDTALALTASQSNPHSVRWEWRFFLIIEDAISQPPKPPAPRPQMALLVAGEDGDYLLNQEAVDFAANPQELARLTEKLFVLWGDLQEQKDEALTKEKATTIKAQSRPFECFIKEYGVPIAKDVSHIWDINLTRLTSSTAEKSKIARYLTKLCKNRFFSMPSESITQKHWTH